MQFDVLAARLGSPVDLSLELTDEKGARLAFAVLLILAVRPWTRP